MVVHSTIKMVPKRNSNPNHNTDLAPRRKRALLLLAGSSSVPSMQTPPAMLFRCCCGCVMKQKTKFVKKHERMKDIPETKASPAFSTMRIPWTLNSVMKRGIQHDAKWREWYVHGNSTASLGSLHLKFSEGCYHAVLLLFSKFLFFGIRYRRVI